MEVWAAVATALGIQETVAARSAARMAVGQSVATMAAVAMVQVQMEASLVTEAAAREARKVARSSDRR